MFVVLLKMLHPTQAEVPANSARFKPACLTHAHRALDEAEAYGWGDAFRTGTLTGDEILARLFRLNQDRAAAQG